MKPVIALVGRPNVGKSTLFNYLTRSRDALVADMPGLTRDRQYGIGKVGERPYIVVDTGGLSGNEQGLEGLMVRQVQQAVDEAHVVLFLVDGRDGLSASDDAIARWLRQRGKNVLLVVNKTDTGDPAMLAAEFHSLGLGEPFTIAAVHGRGVPRLMEQVLAALPEEEEEEAEAEDYDRIKVAIVGRPNVGKSTLVNRILGEERVVVFDMPGTTRDSIFIPFERDGQDYTLIDTAGVRRRARIDEAIEKFSVIKTLQAIEEANVVVMVLDAREGISEQDATLLGFVLDAGRALVLAVNKWDGLSQDQRDNVRRELDLKLPFLDFAKLHYISALHGTGVGDLFGSVKRAYASALRKFSTPELTRLLESALAAHQPPLVGGRRIKLRYAHQGGKNPPLIVIHGNQTEQVPNSYQRYLSNFFRENLKLEGTPVRIEFKTGDNPYAGKRNTLTPRQMQKRKRMVSHIKKAEKKKARKKRM
ncbi:MAG: ribosome biogenesis GTPase Der [Gammaproteobacteria bacterium HGW-Gammaproteobacteria-1]|jgi:GTP-binding protein|nr:MAG: ribosome biogenesis GTPase Der [Gammaproteobacteria bacterium HGW-Gammaproteobacteria-1]